MIGIYVCRERLNSIPEDESELSFGNSVYKIRFGDRDNQGLYGHRYWFFLKDAVEDVPEYVVHWDSFVKSVTSCLFDSKLIWAVLDWPQNTILTWFTKKKFTRYMPRMKTMRIMDLCCNI